MIVLDTTILVYAVGSDHPLRDPCRGLVAAIAERRVEATTTVEVIQEFVHVRARRRDRADAASVGRDYADLLSPLIEVGRDDLLRGLELYERIDKIGAFDAVLAATAANHGAEVLVSADLALTAVGAIDVIAPDDRRLAFGGTYGPGPGERGR